MWKRSNYPSLGNSAALKYQISFYPKDRSTYNEISINFYKYSNPTIGISIHLNNHVAHDKLVSVLEDKYRLSIWKGESSSWMNFNLSTLDQTEAENVFLIINEAVPSLLSSASFNTAFSDILTKAIPTEKMVPWGQSYNMFQNSVASLGSRLKAQMEEGEVKEHSKSFV